MVPCPTASPLVASHPSATLGIPSDAELPSGQQQMVPTMPPSKGLDAGTVTASGGTWTSQWPIKQPPQQWLSTQMWTNLSTSPLLPGKISGLLAYPSRVGPPLTSLQSQLAAISPCGTLLAL